VAVTGAGALSGVSITSGTIALWFVACAVPPVVMPMVWHSAPSPTVAEILHAVERRDCPLNPGAYESEAQMSERNGDRARFQKDRERKLRRRWRVRELIKALRTSRQTFIGSANATRASHDGSGLALCACGVVLASLLP
jgi:hypothetical protein